MGKKIKVINNTKYVRHLPRGAVLQPGVNEIEKKFIDANRSQSRFERAIKSGELVVAELEQVKKAEKIENKKQEEVDEYLKDNGGGWYILSDGSKVRGKRKALERQKELDKVGE